MRSILLLTMLFLYVNVSSTASEGHGSDTIVDVMYYVYTRFLSSCGTYVFWNPLENLDDVSSFIKRVNSPLMVVTLNSTTNGFSFPQQYTFPNQPNCSAYIFLSSKVADLHSLILSSSFWNHMDELGRFVFVVYGAELGEAQTLLDNKVMAWIPNAILIHEIEKEQLNGPNLYSYEIWSHLLFQQNTEKLFYFADRWAHGEIQRGAELFPDKLNNFEGNPLIGVTFEHAPSIVELHHGTKTDGHSLEHHYDGIDIRLLHILANALNFDLHIQNPSDGGKWGSPLENGTWSGLLGDITEKRAHMGVANLFIHVVHLQVVEMTTAYDMESGCFITPLPEPLPQWMALYFPFSYEVWLVALVALIVGPIFLFIIALLSRTSSSTSETDSIWLSSFSMTVYYTTASFFGIGIANQPTLNVTRNYYVMWVWFGLLITVVYRSALTAFLTIPLTQPPIDTLEQLISSSLPAWGATGSTFKKMLSENPDPMIQQLALKYKQVSGAKEGIKLTTQREYAMMENRQFLEYTIATNFTNKYGEETLHVMKECFLPFRIGMAMPKKAPYKKNFDRVITKIVESGLVRKWFRDILFASQNRNTEGSEERSSGSLTINNLQATWLILGIGYCMSIVVLVIEVLCLGWKDAKFLRY